MIREGHPLALVGFPSSSVRKNDRNRIFKSGRQQMAARVDRKTHASVN